MKAKPYNWHPKTTGWASMKLNIAFIRFLWELARTLKINKLYGIPDKKQLPVDRG